MAIIAAYKGTIIMASIATATKYAEYTMIELIVFIARF